MLGYAGAKKENRAVCLCHMRRVMTRLLVDAPCLIAIGRQTGGSLGQKRCFFTDYILRLPSQYRGGRDPHMSWAPIMCTTYRTAARNDLATKAWGEISRGSDIGSKGCACQAKSEGIHPSVHYYLLNAAGTPQNGQVFMVKLFTGPCFRCAQ